MSDCRESEGLGFISLDSRADTRLNLLCAQADDAPIPRKIATVNHRVRFQSKFVRVPLASRLKKHVDKSSVNAIAERLYRFTRVTTHQRSHGLAVRTLDSESSNPSSNLGGTLVFFHLFLFFLWFAEVSLNLEQLGSGALIDWNHYFFLVSTDNFVLGVYSRNHLWCAK
jgi:hypothetical protein